MFRRLSVLALALALFSVPVLAQTPAPTPPLPTFFLLSGTIQRAEVTDQAGDQHYKYVGSLDIGMGKDITPTQRAFATTRFIGTALSSGGAAGAGYDFVAWASPKGTRLILGGEGDGTFGGVNDASSLIGVGKLGVEVERKNIRGGLFITSQQPIQTGTNADSLRQVAVTLRLAFLNR